MNATPRIAIDAMGGDGGVDTMLAGAAMAAERHAGLRFLLVGDRAAIAPALNGHPALRLVSDIVHTEGLVAGDEKPGQALRKMGTDAEERGLPDMADDAILDAMVANPAYVNRPFVETDKGVRFCRPQDVVREIV